MLIRCSVYSAQRQTINARIKAVEYFYQDVGEIEKADEERGWQWPVRNDSNFIGSVALAPVGRIYDQLNFSGIGPSHNSGPPTEQAALGYLTLHTWAMQTAFPDVNVTSFLSYTFARRFALAQKLSLCLAGASSLTGDLKQEELFAPDGGQQKWFSLLQTFQQTYGAGQGHPSFAPLLIVQSEGDLAVPFKAAELAYTASCDAVNDVELALIPLLDHSATFGATAAMWMPWLKKRILEPSYSSQKKCSKEKKAAVDLSAAYAPLDSQGY